MKRLNSPNQKLMSCFHCKYFHTYKVINLLKNSVNISIAVSQGEHTSTVLLFREQSPLGVKGNLRKLTLLLCGEEKLWLIAVLSSRRNCTVWIYPKTEDQLVPSALFPSQHLPRTDPAASLYQKS